MPVTDRPTQRDRPAARHGRPPLISRDAVIEAGVAVGLPDLSVKAVAERLGVRPSALYHHVTNLHDLHIAVGDHIAASLQLPIDAADAPAFLLDLARSLLELERRHPGIGAFFAAAEPDARAARAVVQSAAEHLATRGVAAVDAQMLTGIVANMAFAFAGRERTERPGAHDTQLAALFDWVVRNAVGSMLAGLPDAPWRA